jgi:DNA-binding MarR family transcriptional regulator
MFPMSSALSPSLGLGDSDALRLGEDGATRIRTFRLVVLLAQELRTLMDQQLRSDDLTTQQAALISVVDAIGKPSLSEAAAALATTHQNVKQIAASLVRKGFLEISRDDLDARVRRLHTTRKSKTTWQRRSAADQQMVLEWFSTLSEREAKTLFTLLLRLESGVRAQFEPEPAGRSSAGF